MPATDTKLTAADVIERIKRGVGVPWRSETVDTVKAGNPETVVTGIATTFAATYDVLQRAAASGKNLIITHEPTFYNHLDRTDEIGNDPVLAQKREFIARHHLVIFRFHDHWHMRRPDGVLEGVTHALGWENYQSKSGPGLFVVPETTLEHLAATVRDRMKIRTMRVIGDPNMKVTRAGLAPGAAGSTDQIRMFERDDVQVLLVGESREWETVEYARDAAAEGRHKALIILGHVASEEAGMDNCARWLKGLVPGVPVEFIPAGEPFWAPR
jgi:putative NIF3 family GTP cyclohydrolase 1 type 2